MPSASVSPEPTSGLRAAVVVLAAGEGRRTGSRTNKVLLPLAGRRVFTWSIRSARLLPEVRRTVLVIREQDRDAVDEALVHEVGPLEVDVVLGGSSRHGSEWEALQLLAPAIEAGEIDVVVIHDAARPLAGPDLWDDVIRTAAATSGGAIPAEDHDHLATLDGSALPEDRVVAVQTPQAFAAVPLLEAYRRAAEDGFIGTDTAACIERYTDVPVQCVPGDATNIKITFPDDLAIAERLLAKARAERRGSPRDL